MRYSIGSLLIWTTVIALLVVMTQQLLALAVFLFAMAIPIAMLVHVRFPRLVKFRILFVTCSFLSSMPLYFAAAGPLYFVAAGYESRSKQEEFFKAAAPFFAPAYWVYARTIPDRTYNTLAQRYYGEWMIYGRWYYSKNGKVP